MSKADRKAAIGSALGQNDMLTFPGLDFTDGIQSMRIQSAERLDRAGQNMANLARRRNRGNRGAKMNTKMNNKNSNSSSAPLYSGNATISGSSSSTSNTNEGAPVTTSNGMASEAKTPNTILQSSADSNSDLLTGLIPNTSGLGNAPLIPDPQILNAYDPATREMLLGFVDREIRAQFDDESRRQDSLTAAEIRQSQRGQLLSVFIIVITIVAAGVVGIIVRDAAMVGAFLALPFAAIIGNLFRPVISRSDRGSNQSG